MDVKKEISKPPPDPKKRIPLYWKLIGIFGVFGISAGYICGVYFGWGWDEGAQNQNFRQTIPDHRLLSSGCDRNTQFHCFTKEIDTTGKWEITIHWENPDPANLDNMTCTIIEVDTKRKPVNRLIKTFVLKDSGKQTYGLDLNQGDHVMVGAAGPSYAKLNGSLNWVSPPYPLALLRLLSLPFIILGFILTLVFIAYFFNR
ncbi:MAG: hypothetical protein E3J72_14975 [Planctomycetota bacterium]|nr:MAG: hypothetical protein E3J72_14975 [Planctomycetota bacterium]